MITHNQDKEALYTDHWHDAILGKYQLKDNKNILNFRLLTTPSGCGSVIMKSYCIWGEFSDVLKEDLQKVLDQVKDNGVGAIITTLGQHFYNDKTEKLLTDIFDMKCVSEYSNYRHHTDGNYKQKLYIRIL